MDLHRWSEEYRVSRGQRGAVRILQNHAIALLVPTRSSGFGYADQRSARREKSQIEAVLLDWKRGIRGYYNTTFSRSVHSYMANTNKTQLAYLEKDPAAILVPRGLFGHVSFSKSTSFFVSSSAERC